MSKKIEVTIVRRTYTTYEVEVADDFAADTNVVDVFIGYLRRKLEGGGMDWELVDEEVANWDIDYVGEVR